MDMDNTSSYTLVWESNAQRGTPILLSRGENTTREQSDYRRDKDAGTKIDEPGEHDGSRSPDQNVHFEAPHESGQVHKIAPESNPRHPRIPGIEPTVPWPKE